MKVKPYKEKKIKRERLFQERKERGKDENEE